MSPGVQGCHVSADVSVSRRKATCQVGHRQNPESAVVVITPEVHLS